MVVAIDLNTEALARIGQRIDNAWKRVHKSDSEWIEGSLELIKALGDARERFTSNQAFGEWLGENGHDHVNKDDRAALIGMSSDPELARDVLTKTDRRSYQHIWNEAQSRFLHVKKTTRRKGKADGKPRPRGSGKTADKYQRTREAVREPVAAGKLNTKKVAEEQGVSVDTVERAALAEQARVELLDELKVDPTTLAPSAQAKLEIAKRQVERQLKAEHAERMRGLEEEIRLRVVAQGKVYVENMKEMETKAWEDQKHWRAMVNDHKPPFTKDQFKVILMCLHPDGERTPEKLTQAFRLFNSKKLQLSGEK